MPQLLPKNPTLRLFLIVVAISVFLGGSYLGARRIVWPFFKNWREQRANHVAREFLEKGDYNNALLAVRKTLTYNQMNVDAWRLGVEISEKQGNPQAVLYEQRVANLQPTFENRLSFIELALKYHAFSEADAMVDKVGAQGAKSAEFLEHAATISRHLGNTTKAKYYLMSLIGLQPDNSRAQLDLAQIRLMDGVDENKPSIRAEIRNLATNPELRPRALGLLLSDSLHAKDSAQALEIADQLALVPNLTPTDAILVLEADRRYAPARSGTYLSTIEKSFSDHPEQVAVLTSYLVGNGMADEARRYIESLDSKVRGTEGIQLNYAYALLTLKDWTALETFLRGSKWNENEFARYALLAYRYRVAGKDREFNDAWHLAMIEVGNDPHRLQVLLSQVNEWGWTDQEYDLLWKRFLIDPSNTKLRNELVEHERRLSDTGALNRLFSRVLEVEPNDLDSKNNYAYTCMLLGINLDRAYQAAAEVHQAKPHNPFFLTTEAFALYRQGKYADALELIQSLDPVAASQPDRMLISAVILIANNRFEEGATEARPLRLDRFLPEERSLLTRSLALVDRAHEQAQDVARLAAITTESHGIQNPKGFLHLLPATFAENATVPISLADSLYAADDFKGLEANLRDARWKDEDFLRLALLAYAQQRQGQREGDARQTWLVAVASAGNESPNLSALDTLANKWGWQTEHVELLNRILQRDPSDNSLFQQLAAYYGKNNQTGDLARIYQLHIDADATDLESKCLFAYYSMLVNSNLSRAFTSAKEAFDAAPNDQTRIKVYAFALYKQSRSQEGWPLVEKLADQKESGPMQLALIKGALAAQQHQFQDAHALIAAFDPTTALPEEAALASSVDKLVLTATSADKATAGP